MGATATGAMATSLWALPGGPECPREKPPGGLDVEGEGAVTRARVTQKLERGTCKYLPLRSWEAALPPWVLGSRGSRFEV